MSVFAANLICEAKELKTAPNSFALTNSQGE